MLNKNLFAAAVLSCTLFGYPLAIADENPAFASWAQYNVGTSVTQKQSRVSLEKITENEMVCTLLEKSDEKLIVELRPSTFVDGNKIDLPVRKIEIFAQTTQPANKTPKTDTSEIEKKESEETITVGDQEYLAQVVSETTRTVDQSVIRTTTWEHPDVPGLLLKMVTTVEGEYDMTIEVVDIVIK